MTSQEQSIASLYLKMPVLPALFILLVSAATRFYELSAPAIWSDEAFSLLLSKLPPDQIIAHAIQDVHPPLYYLVLHAWMVFFGESVFAARSLSALAGVGTVLLGMWLLRLLSTSRASLLGGGLLALLPMAVRYSQEIRMYSLFGFFMMGAAIALIYWVSNPTNNKALAAFSALMLSGAYLHYFAGVCMASFWCFVLFSAIRDKTVRLDLSKWCLANLFVFLFYLPWIPSFLHQMTNSGFSWIVRPDLHTVAAVVWQFINYSDGYGQSQWLLYGVSLGFLLMSLVPVLSSQEAFFGGVFLGLYTWFPILFVLMVSLFYPLFVDRYFLFAGLGLPLIIGLVLNVVLLKSKFCFWFFLFVVLVFEVSGLFNVHARGHAVYDEINKIDEVADYVNANYRVGDAVLVINGFLYFPLCYYNKTEALPMIYTPLDENGASTRPNGYQIWTLTQKRASEIYLDRMDELKSDSGRVWVVNSRDSTSDVPDYWHLVDAFRAGDSYVQLYEVSSEPKEFRASFFL